MSSERKGQLDSNLSLFS